MLSLSKFFAPAEKSRAPRTRRNDFRVLCILGSGGFGVVKLVEPKKPRWEDEVYAMKVGPKKPVLGGRGVRDEGRLCVD